MPGVPRTEDDDESWSEAVVKVAEDVSKASTAQQLAIGGVSGWVCGYSFCKVGKWAAIALGSGILIVQVASYNGWMKVNRSKFERQVDRVKRKLSKEFSPEKMPSSKQITGFVKQNTWLAGGFAGGFLLGMGSA